MAQRLNVSGWLSGWPFRAHLALSGISVRLVSGFVRERVRIGVRLMSGGESPPAGQRGRAYKAPPRARARARGMRMLRGRGQSPSLISSASCGDHGGGLFWRVRQPNRQPGALGRLCAEHPNLRMRSPQEGSHDL